MPWLELSVDTTHESVDWVRSLLSTIDDMGDGVGDVHVVRYADGILVREQDPEWDFTVCFCLPYTRQATGHTQEIADRLSPLHRTGLTTALQTRVLEEKPNYGQDYQTLIQPIGDRFVVLPADMLYQSTVATDIPVRLEKSLAFGSGLHPATRLSLRLLERHIIPGMNVLDLGSGTGILSIAMAKLGATVLALDNDPVAVQATEDAVQQNDVEQHVIVRVGSLGSGSDLGHWMGGDLHETVPTIAPAHAFDLIVANILARVHISLAPDFHQALRRTTTSTGLLITAGFTTDYETEVDAALKEAGFTAIDCERDQEWVALAHQLNAA